MLKLVAFYLFICVYALCVLLPQIEILAGAVSLLTETFENYMIGANEYKCHRVGGSVSMRSTFTSACSADDGSVEGTEVAPCNIPFHSQSYGYR